MAFEQYAIAAGYNVALVSLVNLETVTAPGDNIKFFGPQAIPHGSPGVRRGRLNGVGFRAGYSRVDWLFGVLTRAQYEYLKTTYCGGIFSGQVTIYTTVSGRAFARYNAVIDVPETEVIPDGFYAYRAVPVHFTHLVAI